MNLVLFISRGRVRRSIWPDVVQPICVPPIFDRNTAKTICVPLFFPEKHGPVYLHTPVALEKYAQLVWRRAAGKLAEEQDEEQQEEQQRSSSMGSSGAAEEQQEEKPRNAYLETPLITWED